MDFPQISVLPVAPLDHSSEDAVIRDSKDAGYVSTRPRFTRVRRDYTLRFEGATQEDADIIDNFYHVSCANGSVMFAWTHPTSGVTKNCRFKSPVKYSNTSFGYYTMTIELEQV